MSEQGKTESHNGPETNKVERPVAPSGGFLQGFLAAREVETVDQGEASEAAETLETAPDTKEELQENIITVLRQIYDPEIPVNIYDMGLIYAIDVLEDWSVDLMMTLTSPHCPVAETMPGEVEMKVKSVAGVNEVNMQLVWDPPWDMGKMSDEARLELGLL